MKKLHLLIFLFVCFASGPLLAQSQRYTFLEIKGHLDKEVVKSISDELKGKEGDLAIVINSSSGDIQQAFNLAKKLYEYKVENDARIVVYLDDNVIGPSAMIPFLADEMYSSLFVSWGAIPYESDQKIPANILRNRVKSLISPGNPKFALLSMLASGMSDPSLLIIDEKGWKIHYGEVPSDALVISPKDEALVLNQQQLKALELVEEAVSLEQFLNQYRGDESIKVKESPEVATSKLDRSLGEHIRYNPDGENTIGYIAVDQRDSMISRSTWIYVKKALDYYKEKKPAFIILELNTPGGEVFAAQKISNALKEMDTLSHVPVLAYINNWAISAGAMLAYSCRYIAASQDASMGAAEPIIMGAGEVQTASEKVTSALRSEFANIARYFDRNPDIAEAMVDKDIILVLRHDKVVKLDSEAQIRTEGPNPDVVISGKGKLLTLNSKQLISLGVADMLIESTATKPITAQEKEKGQWPASKSPIFQYSFFKKIPNAMIDKYLMDWQTQFFVLLTSPIVSSLLFLGMMFGFYMEMNTPGFGVMGSLALTCLALIVMSNYALEIGGWLEILLMLIGLALIGIELFVIPSFGIVGILGIVFFFAGLFGIMLPAIGDIEFQWDTKTLNAAGEEFFRRLAWLSGTLILGVVIIGLLGKYVLPKFAYLNPFILRGEEQDASKGYFAGVDPKKLPPPGSEGKVIATLRPSGKVIIDDKIYDVVSAGEFIEIGCTIRVAQLNGSVMVVEKKEDENLI